MAMPLDNPLEIPEITGIVASYLAPKDLASCLRVSKEWLALFLPHRWKSINVGFKPSKKSDGSISMRSFSRFGPHAADIYRHRHLIHNLKISGDLDGLDKYIYPNLRKLVVDYYHGAKEPDRMIFLELVEMFPLVESLDLDYVKIEAATWLTLSTHSHITTLSLEGIVITSSAVSGFWRTWTKLECLVLRGVTIEGGAIPDDVMFLRLTSLSLCHMDLYGAQQLRLIFQCPALRSFEWRDSEWDDGDTYTVTKDLIPNEGWPHLKVLEIEGRDDTEVASILEGIGNQHEGLDRLHLYDCAFLDQSSRALELHFSTLVDLTLPTLSVPSAVIPDILCSCPRLQSLFVGCVLVRDIVNGGDWACRQLKTLRICFRLEEGEQDLQHDLFTRLSSLVRLECLSMGYHEPEGTHRHSTVEFRLENGLGQLASLKQLKILKFHGCCPQLSMDEIAWMKVHWKNLTITGGPLHKEHEEDENLKAAMKILGIPFSK
ncbi:MAG: hypothetical protein J3Q66DRAFT_334970 [Benniella sp.]|nr:MAG: hypothetical protein J3Q66DRAFT_334970 [Benniella sp.]